MKKILFYISIITIAVTAASCSKMLDRYPRYSIPLEAVTENDIPAMRMGLYSGFQTGSGPGVRSYIMLDIMGGNIRGNTGTALDQINSFTKVLNSYVQSSWDGYFYVLYQANNLLAGASQYSTAEALLAQGEAHYFRAYIYYCMAVRWGDAIILRQNTMDKDIARTPVEEVWGFIEEELTLAIDLLGNSSSYYYVSKDAATALMARVKLYRGKNGEATELAESLIGKYKLDTFEKIFRGASNSEIIFAFENRTEESSINISDLYYTYAHENKGQGTYKPTSDLIALFADEDNRKGISFTVVQGQTLINKYPSGQTGTDPFIVSRIAEMYLISAEAQGRTAGVGRLNELRTFRGLSALNGATLTDDTYMDAVMDERRRELMGENFLYYDLVRTGRAVEELGMQSYQVLLPVPGRELKLNALLSQNPGYGSGADETEE
jgi:hypothetical protein